MTTTLSAQSSQATTRLNAIDRKLFRGTAAEVQSWMSTTDVLRSIGCDFQVALHSPSVNGRTYDDCKLWLRSDNQDMLGVFGNRRAPTQPGDFVDFFRAFCAASEKQISLDLVGCLDQGRTFYMASKLTEANTELIAQATAANGGLGIARKGSSHYIDSEDRTDFWLVLTDYYKESLSPKAVVFGNELICTNGMTLRVTDQQVKLHHRNHLTYELIAPVLQRTLEQSAAYSRMKQRLIEIPVSMDTARDALRKFFCDPQAETKTVRKLEQIYAGDLIGGELDTRKDNAWRLVSTVTQYTSHERTGGQGDRTLKSQLEGSRARTNTRFIEFLESQFGSVRELALT